MSNTQVCVAFFVFLISSIRAKRSIASTLNCFLSIGLSVSSRLLLLLAFSLDFKYVRCCSNGLKKEKKETKKTRTFFYSIQMVSFSMVTLLPVLILQMSILSMQGISLIIAPTATMVSHSLFIMPAGADPFFFIR